MQINYSSKDYFNLFGHTLSGVRAQNWFQLLSANRSNLDYRFAPKLLMLSIPVLLNYPIQKIEAYRFDNRIKDIKIKSPVFILGHYRSGTTYLHEVLCQDHQFAFCSTNQALNPLTFLTTGAITQAFIKAFLPTRRPMDNMTMDVNQPMEEEFALACMSKASLVHSFYFPKEAYNYFDKYVLLKNPSDRELWQTQFDYFMKKLAFVNPNKTILFKSPGNTGRIKEILTLYPDARFIHIHRNPYEVYQSTTRLYEKLLPLHGFQRVEESFITDYILYAYEKMYSKYLNDIKELNENQLIEISYEQFTSRPIDTINQIYNRLRIEDFDLKKPMFIEEISSRASYQKNDHVPLSTLEYQKINQQWSFMFEAYDYGMTE